MDFLKRLNDFLRRANPFRQNEGLASIRTSAASASATRELVISQSAVSVDRYRINDDRRHVDEVFGRIANSLMELCDRISMDARRGLPGHVVLREQGSTDDGRQYLFMKPMNEHGWLMEKSTAGWRFSRSEKIVGQNLFLRSNEDPWDLATLWSDAKGERMMRINSSRFGRDLLSISEYERRLLDSFTDLFTRGALH